MIYASERFKKQFSKLSYDYKNQIRLIADKIISIRTEEQSKYLESLCGENGKAKWTGISKTLYHMYPQGQKITHRLFYCYVTDLDPELRNATGLFEGIVFIDYTTRKEDEDRAAINYDKYPVKFLSKFLPQSPNATQPFLSKPQFWFCLTTDQKNVLELKQPALVKGSAGTGKTIISFELLKHWIESINTGKYLYLTYTKQLLRKAKETLYEDGVQIDILSLDITDFTKLKGVVTGKKVIDESNAREIIKSILATYIKINRMPNEILFTDYFIYSYIRGLLKGRVSTIECINLDYEKANMFLTDYLVNCTLSQNEKMKLKRLVLDVIEKDDINEKIYNHNIIPAVLAIHENKKDKERFKANLSNLFGIEDFNKLNGFRIKKTQYEYISNNDTYIELEKDGFSEKHINLLLEIRKKYDNALSDQNMIDDNDYAKLILNQGLEDQEKYDGIIVDEVQDLTETQIEAIVTLSKKESLNISFFGDPNQTINPTVYNYGRFNSFVYRKTQNINRKTIKITHRCGPNLLEYINHLVKLRKKFQLTTNQDDLELEQSAISKTDTYWACLVTDNSIIDKVFDEFTRALDCIIIVNDENSKNDVIQKITKLTTVDTDYLNNQIITVQQSKGLESKNVIIYNIISDNIEIFTNLENQNKKISTMTFNKLYVSCTRAEDSIIIIEEKLNDYLDIKTEYFYPNGKPIIENITEDMISDYLSITINPILFYEQAEIALEDFNFERALRKVNISIKNSIDQFKEDEELQWVRPLISTDSKLLLTTYINTIELDYRDFIDDFDDLISNSLDLGLDSHKIDLLKNRYECLINGLNLKRACHRCIEFEEYEDLMQDDDKTIYIKDLILLRNQICSSYLANKLVDSKTRYYYITLIKYLHGYLMYDQEVRDILNNIKMDDEIYTSIILKMVERDAFNDIESILKKLEGYI